MPEIRPFDAWRYNTETAGSWESLCCPPYDVVSEDARAELEKRNPYNCIKLEKPSGADGYARAAALFDEWRSSGALERDGVPAYYVYSMAFKSGGKQYTLQTFTGRCALTPFSEGQVLPHENTLAKARADRMELMRAMRCNVSPIFALYSDPGQIVPGLLDGAVRDRAPDVEFDLDGVVHRMWKVTDELVLQGVGEFFADKQVFIADGHHRYETAVAYYDEMKSRGAAPGHPSGYIMMTLADMENPCLVVLPTHRVVYGCEPEAYKRLLGECQECPVDSIEQRLSAQRGAIAMYADKKAWILIPRGGKELDVETLHDVYLEPYFGIDAAALAAQRSLIYTRDIGEAVALVDEGRGQCAFLLSPTRLEQIRDVSLAGGKMPQKSTYFYPKLITGLYINGLE